jgi:nitrite reductase/ring-hydroxylating ferredoxin subunit
MLNTGVEGAVTSAPDTMNDARSRRRGTGALQRQAVDEEGLDRRRFLSLTGCAAMLVAAGEWLGARLDAATHGAHEVTWPDAASIARGESRAVAASDGRETLVVKLQDGDVVAFDRRCPHLGCPVLWSPEHARFECPCHHAAFDARTGRVLFGPPRRGLTRARLHTV